FLKVRETAKARADKTGRRGLVHRPVVFIQWDPPLNRGERCPDHPAAPSEMRDSRPQRSFSPREPTERCRAIRSAAPARPLWVAAARRLVSLPQTRAVPIEEASWLCSTMFGSFVLRSVSRYDRGRNTTISYNAMARCEAATPRSLRSGTRAPRRPHRA